jgi:hypothetical protein
MGLIKGRVKGGRGTLVVDNRASGGKLIELPTLTCGHCFSIVVLNKERKRTRGYCRTGHHYICDKPGCQIQCTPIEQALDLIIKYPGLPALSRGYKGELLFNPEYLKEGKVY